jgi:hypothetical protein
MRHETRLESANGRNSGRTQWPWLRAVARAAARCYAMSFRLLTDVTGVPYLAFIARMVAGAVYYVVAELRLRTPTARERDAPQKGASFRPSGYVSGERSFVWV